MPVDIPYNEPAEIRAGDDTSWLKAVPDYLPADGWVLKYYLTDQTNAIPLTATTSGTEYLIAITSAASAAWVPSVYRWAAFVEKGAERHTVDSGTGLRILPNLAVAVAYDTRTDARQIYDSLIAKYKAFIATGGEMQSMSIAGKAVQFRTAADFILQIEHWAKLVEREEAAEAVAKGFSDPRKVGVRFRRI